VKILRVKRVPPGTRTSISHQLEYSKDQQRQLEVSHPPLAVATLGADWPRKPEDDDFQNMENKRRHNTNQILTMSSRRTPVNLGPYPIKCC